MPTLPTIIKGLVMLMFVVVELQFWRLKLCVLQLLCWLLKTVSRAVKKWTAWLERLRWKLSFKL